MTKTAQKITSKTSLSTIRELVNLDFNVAIDNRDAKEIRSAARRGALLWTGEKLVITGGSYLSLIREDFVRETSGATHTGAEWASQ